MFKNFHIRPGLLGLSLLFLVAQTLAHSGATGIVKERMEAMGILGDHAKAVGDMLKGKTPFDSGTVEAAASAFVTQGELLPSYFPDTEPSRSGAMSEALPVIWTDWGDFVALSARFTQDSQALADAVSAMSAEGQDSAAQVRAVRKAFFKASRSCSACHERFRLDQD